MWWIKTSIIFSWHPFDTNRDSVRVRKLADSRYSRAPLFRSPKEMEKKLEIAGFRSSRGSVKFVNSESSFNKTQYIIKKDTD